MKRFFGVVLVLAFLVSGCGTFGDSANISVRNKPTSNVKLTDVVDELTENYGEANVKYRAYKMADGTPHVVKDMYFDTGDGYVIVTVVNDEVKEIISPKH